MTKTNNNLTIQTIMFGAITFVLAYICYKHIDLNVMLSIHNDNIFSNNISDVVKSGNIHFTLSEHFSQFPSVKHQKIDVRNILMYGRDFSKFSEDKFRDDVSIQTWCHNTDDQSFNE